MSHDKAILTCALTGVLTNPKQHPVPVTPAQMAPRRATPSTPAPA
jgi:3-keto-5-aminohexanoate cleavage enzyme